MLSQLSQQVIITPRMELGVVSKMRRGENEPKRELKGEAFETGARPMNPSPRLQGLDLHCMREVEAFGIGG
jgi:hypothetical protein